MAGDRRWPAYPAVFGITRKAVLSNALRALPASGRCATTPALVSVRLTDFCCARPGGHLPPPDRSPGESPGWPPGRRLHAVERRVVRGPPKATSSEVESAASRPFHLRKRICRGFAIQRRKWPASTGARRVSLCAELVGGYLETSSTICSSRRVARMAPGSVIRQRGPSLVNLRPASGRSSIKASRPN